MAGFRDYSLDKFIPKIIDSGYTAVVYVQEKKNTGIIRKLEGIYSPGTYLSNENTKPNNITKGIIHKQKILDNKAQGEKQISNAQDLQSFRVHAEAFLQKQARTQRNQT